MLLSEDAAEPGEYRSTKTPWTRRLQELIKNPVTWVWDWGRMEYVLTPVSEVNVKKSSQSGYSEACLNGVRWFVSYRPRNTIYAIDSADEAKKIARRLLRSFKFLDPSIFTGDPDDIKTLEFQLRGMELFFYGSFSKGKFANKQAPFLISDEVEEHGQFILGDLASRKKTSTGGLQINLSKPKLKSGPITQAFNRGNQEEFFAPCPHCGQLQYRTFFPTERDVPFHPFKDRNDLIEMPDGTFMPKPLPLGEVRKMKTGRFVFDHCKNLLGKWDLLRVLNETYYECAECHGVIDRSHKRWLLDNALWLPMVIDNAPSVVSQHMSDFYSEDELSSEGQIATEYIEAKRGSTQAKQDFRNHRCGEAWSEEANKTQIEDIKNNLAGRSVWFVDAPNSEGQVIRNIFYNQESAARLSKANADRGVDAPVIHSACPAYRRGTIPFEPFRRDLGGGRQGPPTLILGSDVGGNYARWVVLAVHKNIRDAALIDWGEELDPDSICLLAMGKTWPIIHGNEQCRITSGWIDARHRPSDVYKACLRSRGILIPTKGLGGAAALNVKMWTYVHVPSYHERFCELHYNDQRAKDMLYTDRIKRMRSRLWFPVDAPDDERLMEEMCAESQREDKKGKLYWPDDATNNHYGDSVKEAMLGLNYMTREIRM